jgi:hypothetical protein
MILKKLCSGAQSGADIAGLKAAKDFGLETGGWIPKGFKTLDGPKPEYAELYNIKEIDSYSYKVRTWANVKDSDATVRFAKDFKSSGEICTMNGILRHKKPNADVLILDTNNFETEENNHPEDLAKWIMYYNIKVLNVAGNSEQTALGIEKWVYKYLMAMFKELVRLDG